MTLSEVKGKLGTRREALREFHVDSLSIFGSVARGDAGKDSDVDLLVKFSEPVGLFEFARLRDFLEELLGTRVDLVTPAALRESMRDTIRREAVRAA